MNMMSNLNLQAMVVTDHGQPMTTSYAVAEAFGKKHSHVMRDLKKLTQQCGDKFTKSNFGLTFEIKKIGNSNRKMPFYRMSKDGFMLLVMGYSGDAAMQIKLAYIDAFNWMTSQLERILKSDMARYNQVSLKREQRKQHVSCSARDMRTWQDEKPVFDAELARLENKMQPQLPYLQGV